MYRLAVLTSCFMAVLSPPLAGQDWMEGSAGETSPLIESRTLFSWNGIRIAGDPDELESMATDRPDFTEASSTVERGVTQIESGYTFTTDSNASGRIDSHSLGEILVRQGTSVDWLELRLGVFPVHERAVGGPAVHSESGLEDLYLGAKAALTLQDGWMPEMALVLQTDVPTGHPTFTSGKWLPGFNWLYGWDVTDELTTAGSTQMNYALDDNDRGYAEFAQSWTVGYSLTENVSMYTEWFALIPLRSPGLESEHYANAGLTYAWNENVQFDVRAGAGLNGPAADFFTGAGLSIRWP